MRRLTQTHTVVEMEVSATTHDEIWRKLEEAGYQHAISNRGNTLDMSGIALVREGAAKPERAELDADLHAFGFRAE